MQTSVHPSTCTWTWSCHLFAIVTSVTTAQGSCPEEVTRFREYGCISEFTTNYQPRDIFFWGGGLFSKMYRRASQNSETYPLITCSLRRRCPLPIAHLIQTSTATRKYIPLQILWSSRILTREKAGTGECLACLPDKGFKRIHAKCTLHRNWFNLGFFWTRGP